MTTTAESSFDRTARMLCWSAVIVGLLVNIIVWLQPRGADLADGNAFRQNQTAMTARYLVRDGFKVDYETPVLGPPWSIPMEFPLYQATVAALVRTTNMSLVPAGHLVSMLYFWATLPAVWLLLGRLGVSTSTRRLALGLLLCSPVYLYYGRHFLIETTALCFGTWFLWAFHRALAPGGIVFGLLAVAFGVLAGLSKVTTFFNFGVAAGLILISEIGARRREWLRLGAWSALLVLAPLAVAYWWVQYSDAIKAQHPIGHFLVSSQLREFNFGTAEQHKNPAVWLRFYDMVRNEIVCEPALVVGLLGALVLPRARRWFVAGALFCYVAGVSVFLNLYYVHDYYYVANGIFVVVAVALALEGLLAGSRLPGAVRVGAIAAVLGLQVLSFWRAHGVDFAGPPKQPYKMAEVIDRLTDPEDVIVIIGLDWNSGLLFQSDRRGIMLPGGHEYNSVELQKSIDLLPPRRVGAFIVAGNFRDNLHVIIPMARKLGVTLQPIAEGENMLLYLRRDRVPELARRIGAAHYEGVAVNFTYDPAKDPQANLVDDDLTRAKWRNKFPMASPAPTLATSLFPITVTDYQGTVVIGTHAPNTIRFPIPVNSHRIDLVYGMFEGAYTGKDYTDGCVIEVWQQLPDGNRQRLFQRALLPHDNPGDRGDQTLQLKADGIFAGELLLQVDPGPSGQINYDWVYWRSVKIY